MFIPQNIINKKPSNDGICMLFSLKIPAVGPNNNHRRSHNRCCGGLKDFILKTGSYEHERVLAEPNVACAKVARST